MKKKENKEINKIEKKECEKSKKDLLKFKNGEKG